MHISSVLASFKLLKHLDLAYDVLGDYCEIECARHGDYWLNQLLIGHLAGQSGLLPVISTILLRDSVNLSNSPPKPLDAGNDAGNDR
jgi:hypothetical protein